MFRERIWVSTLEQSKKPEAERLRILILNGVNLDLLGRREAEHYGRWNLADMEQDLRGSAPSLAQLIGLGSLELSFFQTNREEDFLEILTRGWDGAVINAGAWTHTSLAIADRLRALKLLFIEAHISNLSAREGFRQHSYLAPIAGGVVYGLGFCVYRVALFALLSRIAQANPGPV